MQKTIKTEMRINLLAGSRRNNMIATRKANGRRNEKEVGLVAMANPTAMPRNTPEVGLVALFFSKKRCGISTKGIIKS